MRGSGCLGSKLVLIAKYAGPGTNTPTGQQVLSPLSLETPVITAIPRSDITKQFSSQSGQNYSSPPRLDSLFTVSVLEILYKNILIV